MVDFGGPSESSGTQHRLSGAKHPHFSSLRACLFSVLSFGYVLVSLWLTVGTLLVPNGPFVSIGIISMFFMILATTFEPNIAKCGPHTPMKLVQTIFQDLPLFDWFNGVKYPALPTPILKRNGVREAAAGSVFQIRAINLEPHRCGTKKRWPLMAYMSRGKKWRCEDLQYWM